MAHEIAITALLAAGGGVAGVVLAMAVVRGARCIARRWGKRHS